MDWSDHLLPFLPQCFPFGCQDIAFVCLFTEEDANLPRHAAATCDAGSIPCCDFTPLQSMLECVHVLVRSYRQLPCAETVLVPARHVSLWKTNVDISLD